MVIMMMIVIMDGGDGDDEEFFTTETALNMPSVNVRENACIIILQTQARKLSIYKNYIHAAVDGLGTIPVTDEAYDVIVCINGFAPGRLQSW